MKIGERLKRVVLGFKIIAPPVVRDMVGMTGIVLMSYGAWQVYRPAGIIAGGLFLVAIAFLTARSQS